MAKTFIPGPAPRGGCQLDPAFPGADFTPLQNRLNTPGAGYPSPGWCPIPSGVSRGMEPPIHALGQGMGDLIPLGVVRQVRVAAATLPPETRNSSRTFTKTFPSPIPAFPPSRGESRPDVYGKCCHTPDSKAELWTPQNEGQPSCAPRSIPALEEGLGQRPLASGSAPRPRSEQSTPGFARW